MSETENPAETLRRAADAIRKDQDIEENLGHISTREFDTWLAVADLLDAEIRAAIGPAGFDVDMVLPEALIVASTYLGEHP